MPEHKGREALEQALKAQNLPYAKLRGSATLAQVIRDSGFKKAEDFYLALGSGKLQAGAIVNKVVQRLKTEQVAEEAPVVTKAPKARETVSGTDIGVVVPGVTDVLVRLAKCCTPVPGDDDRRLHLARQGDHDPSRRLPEREGAEAQPGAVHATSSGTAPSRRRASACRSPSTRGTARACSRTSRGRSPSTARTSSRYGGVVEDQLAKNRYTAEVGDLKSLRTLLTALRNLEAVFDAYRVTPS